MAFFYADNIISNTLQAGIEPWEFKPTETITAQIRSSKEDRQEWYANSSTKHYFYTGIEPLNPNIRCNREANSPLFIHGLIADYDTLKLPRERVGEAIERMDVKPTWIEKSLGGNWRLVWVLEKRISVSDYDFCTHFLREAVDWLRLDLLPALDEKSFLSPTRLYCNGCEWEETKHGPVPMAKVQSFLVRCASGFRFKGCESEHVSLDIIEKALKEKFPSFDWPAEFLPETQGPTFWIPASTSPMSAILKPGGFYTFSANADKCFYSWADLLGPEFIKDTLDGKIAKATDGVFHDGHKFWRMIQGQYRSAERADIDLFLRVECGLSSKPGKNGTSPKDAALSHIQNHNRIDAALPFVFRHPGPMQYEARSVLNTYTGKPVLPAAEKQTWGPTGNFPFLSLFLDNLFDPAETQLPRVLAWYRHYYQAAFNWTPAPGQSSFFMGGVNTGKTLFNRFVIGVSVGGFADASDYLVDGEAFNSHLLEAPHWCLDDDAPSTSPAAQQRFSSAIKKITGNQQVLYKKKFEVSGMIERMGRVGCSTNLDFVSTRLIGSLDNSALDKINLFRCNKVSKTLFPPRSELEKIITRELPFFLRWLLDYAPPEFVAPCQRYGYESFQEAQLLDQTHQSSPVAPFKEVLMEALISWFSANSEADSFSGSLSQILRMMREDPRNEWLFRTMRVEQVSRYLEQIEKEQILKCSIGVGPTRTRIWSFARDPILCPKPSPDKNPLPEPSGGKNPFVK